MWMSVDTTKLVGLTGKVAKASEFASLMEAHEILAQAREYARRSRRALDEQRDAAIRSGYEEGERQAREEFAQTITETTAHMESAFVGLEARIVNTVMTAVRHILGELDERVLVERVVRRVLAEARAEKSLRLRVASSQFDTARQALAEVLKDFPDIEFIDVIKDPQAAAGTCVLESEFGAVDASVETQLVAVRRGLISSMMNKRPSGARSA